VAAVAAAAMLIGAERAAAQPESTVEVRLRSVNDLLDKAEYVGGVLGKDEPVKQVRELVKQLSADGKGVEGIDPKRPFGAYAILTQDVANSPVVVMIPVADQERILGALKDRVGIVPEKVDGGALKANVPVLNEVYMRFANGYLYLARDAKHIEAKALANPKSYFTKDDGAVVSVLVHMDRIPKELKELVLGQLELGVQQELKKEVGNATEKKIKGLVFDSLVGGTKMVIDDAKDASLKVFIDQKGDNLSLEIALTPKAGTPLAKTIAGLSGKSSLPAGIVTTKDTVARGGVKVELTPDMRKQVGTAIDDLIADVVKQAGDQATAQKVADALLPTLKSGDLDAAIALTGPDAKGRYGFIAAVAVKDGKGIEGLLKEFAPFIPGNEAEVTFDVEKIGSFALHKVIAKGADEEFERIFGTRNVWLAISDDCIAVSIEPDGTAIKAGLKAKPTAAQVFNVDVALAKALPLFEKKLTPDEIKEVLKDAFGSASPNGKDTLSVSVTGGSKLTLRVNVKGKVIRLGTTLDAFKIK